MAKYKYSQCGFINDFMCKQNCLEKGIPCTPLVEKYREFD